MQKFILMGSSVIIIHKCGHLSPRHLVVFASEVTSLVLSFIFFPSINTPNRIYIPQKTECDLSIMYERKCPDISALKIPQEKDPT